MKNLFIFLALCCFVAGGASGYAQNTEIQSLPIDFNDTTVFMTKQKDFIIGWHWGDAEKLVNERLRTNAFHNHWGWQGTRDHGFPKIGL